MLLAEAVFSQLPRATVLKPADAAEVVVSYPNIGLAWLSRHCVKYSSGCKSRLSALYKFD